MADENSMEKTSSDEEKIGFHKGSLSTLAKEREELNKMVNVVEQLMQMHIKQLKELGVDLDKEAKDMQQKDRQNEEKSQEKQEDKSKKIDELIN